jgi:hypothetical protein
MALAMLLALAVTTFVLYTIVTRVVTPSTDTTADPYSGVTGTLATVTTSTTSGTNTGGTDGAIGGALLVRPSSVTASSILKATSMADFGPTNLLDSDPTSAWVEGVSGTGLGEWVRLDFVDAIPLARIEIANGYQKDHDRFAGNARVKSLELQYSNGVVQVVQLQDVEGLQVIEPSTDETQWIKATIRSIYPTYVWPEAALSEVRVYETAG